MSKRTIDNWLSSPKEIPLATLTLIGRLIEDDREEELERRKRREQPQHQIFSVEVDLGTFRDYSRAALEMHLTVEEWVIHACEAELGRNARNKVIALPGKPGSEGGAH